MTASQTGYATLPDKDLVRARTICARLSRSREALTPNHLVDVHRRIRLRKKSFE